MSTGELRRRWISWDQVAIFLWGWLLFSASLFLVRVHSYDAVNYAYLAQVGLKEGSRFLNQNHLLYHPLSYVYFHLWTALGWQHGSLIPLQLLNAGLGAVCLLLVYRLLKSLTGTTTAWLLTLLLSVSNAFWFYSLEVEVYLLALVWLVALFSRLVRLDQSPTISTREAILIGALFGLAVIAHISNLVFIAVILAALLSAPVNLKNKLKALAGISLVALAVIGLAYGAAILAIGIQGLPSARNWLLSYMAIGLGGNPPENSLLLTLEGISLTWANAGQRSVSVLYLLVGVLYGALAWAGWRANRRAIVLAGVWLLSYLLFFGWWEAGNIEFLLSLTIPALVCLALALERLKAERWRRLVFPVLLAIAALLFYLNISNSLAPLFDITQDTRRTAAFDIQACADQPGDLVVTGAFAMRPWLNYYAGLDNLPVDKFFFPVVETSIQDSYTLETAFSELDQAISQAFIEKRRIFLLGEALQPTPVQDQLGVNRKHLKNFFSSYTLERTSCSYLAGHVARAPEFRLYRLTP